MNESNIYVRYQEPGGIPRVTGIPNISSRSYSVQEVTSTSVDGENKITTKTYSVDIYDYMGTLKSYVNLSTRSWIA
jgi:hypothetical protein